MKPQIVTIGVYGFDKDSFLQATYATHQANPCEPRGEYIL